MAKTGRPKKKIDAELVRKLAHIQCTNVEIGAVVGCDEKTIRNRFSEIVNEARETGKRSLRRMQWKRCREGSDKMLIHLGKQYLGQTERVEQTVEQKGAIGVVFDGDFYGTAARLHALAPASSRDGPDGSGSIQGGRLRPKVGQDGDGADGDGIGPRK